MLQALFAVAKTLRRGLFGAAILCALAAPAVAQNATILPLGKSCFRDASGNPLAAGTINFDIPGTTTAKNTWQDATQSTLNTNPVTLDGSGCGLIYGSGTYRQIVKDSSGNLIWDQLTDQPATSVLIQNGGYVWGGTSTGAANTYAISPSPTVGAYAAGQEFRFLAHQANSGAATLNVSALGAKNIFKAGAAGPVALTGGELQTGQVASVVYDGTQFELVSSVGLSCSSLSNATGACSAAITPTTSCSITDASGASLSITTNYCSYSVFNNVVTVYANITYPVTANGSNASINLPVANPNHTKLPVTMIDNADNSFVTGIITNNSAMMTLWSFTASAPAQLANSNRSGHTMIFTAIYPAS